MWLIAKGYVDLLSESEMHGIANLLFVIPVAHFVLFACWMQTEYRFLLLG
jgi:hypothetical protein